MPSSGARRSLLLRRASTVSRLPVARGPTEAVAAVALVASVVRATITAPQLMYRRMASRRLSVAGTAVTVAVAVAVASRIVVTTARLLRRHPQCLS
jgi:hypothetical protein